MDERRRRWIRATMWIGLLGAALLVWFHGTRSVRLVDADRAPAASEVLLEGSDGTVLTLEDYRGRVVLLNLWAAWCGPCRAEAPMLASLDRELRDRGLVVLGVNVESIPAPEAARSARQLGMSYEIAVPAAPLTGTFRGEGAIPQTWLIDRAGRVRASHTGIASAASLRAACLELLGEPDPGGGP